MGTTRRLLVCAQVLLESTKMTTTTAERREEAATTRAKTGKEVITRSEDGLVEKEGIACQRKERELAGTGMEISKEREAMVIRTEKATDLFRDAVDKMERANNTATATITVTPTPASRKRRKYQEKWPR